MSASAELAARLRQAIQGCTVHIHGPVQAWAAIEKARVNGTVQSEEVAKIAIQACSDRIKNLQEAGVEPNDLRIKKEELTRSFIEQLLK